MSARFPDDMPLLDARAVLRTLAPAGHECPVCRQTVKIYRRPLANVHGRAIAALYAEHGTGLGHWPTVAQRRLPDVNAQGGYLLLGAHWALIEEELIRTRDRGRAGYWRVTELGEAWLAGEQAVPKYAELYNGRCLGLSGPLVTREDVLGEHFNFSELMGLHARHQPPSLFDEAA